MGIDDYMVKPVNFDELILWVRVLVRRDNIEVDRKLTVGNFAMSAMVAYINGHEIQITTREFNLVYKVLVVGSFGFPFLSAVSKIFSSYYWYFMLYWYGR